MQSRFYYLRLNPQAKSFYLPVRERLLTYGGCQIRLPVMRGAEHTAMNDAFSATKAVIADNPETLATMERITARQQGNTITVEVPGVFAAADIPGLRQRMEHAVQKLCGGVTGTPYERELEIYKRLISHVRYRDSGGREDHTAAGPLVLGQGVCEGIAKAYALLLRRCGISAIYVQGLAGETGKEPHAWNMVLLNGKTYHCDITYDITHVCYGYFNLTDEDIRRDHALPCGLPNCDSLEFNYHAHSGTRFENPALLRRYILSSLWKGKSAVNFYIAKNMPGGARDWEAMVNCALLFAPPSLQGYKVTRNAVGSVFNIFK